MDNDFDDIDDSILQESSDENKSSRHARTSKSKNSSSRVSGKKTPSTSSQSNAGKVLAKSWFENIKFSDGFKALLLIISAVFLILVVYLLMTSQMYGTSLIIGTSGLIVFFLYLFTGGVDQVKMNGMVIFCYLFSAAALIGAILPFFYFDKVVLDQEKMMASPLGVIKACVKVVGDEQVPPEMDCKRQKSQWVLNIGGTIDEINLKECVTVECMNREKRSHPERYSNNNIQISGGLVIPLYILVLAIMGAAVNMTRRVPEYQRQVYLYMKQSDEKKSAESDAISCEDAREFMVFQLMQVVSAPIVAITAYYIIVPQTPAVSIVLGVISGFAAETVLVALRAFADKLMPNGVATRIKSNMRKPKSEEG